MKNFAAVDIIKTFSPREIKNFDKFVRSPYFGGTPYIINFWKELKKYYPDFPVEKFSKEKLFKKVYPGKKYDDTLLRKLFSELYKMCEKFLISETVFSDNISFSHMLLKQLSDRQLQSYFENRLSKTIAELNDISEFDYSVFIKRHHVINQKTNNNFLHGRQHLIFRDTEQSLLNIITYALIMNYDNLLLGLKNRELFSTFSVNNLSRSFLNAFNSEKFISSVKEVNIKYADILEMHLNMVKMFEKLGSMEPFLNVKKILFKYSPSMKKKSTYSFFNTLLNYCCMHTNSGNKSFLQESVEIMDFMEKNNMFIYLETGYITPEFYRGIIVNYLEAGESVKALKVLRKYMQKLNPEYMQDIVKLSLADYYYFTGNYAMAIETLHDVNPVIFLDKCNIRLVKLISYFETGMPEECYSHIDSVRNFLKLNKTVAADIVSSFELFLKYYKYICDHKFLDKGIPGSIISHFKSSSSFMEKDWVRKKLEI